MSTTPVRKEIIVEAPRERAFRVFTENMEAWWPREHHIGASPMKRAVLETRLHGRWYEVGEDGTECEWGKVLVWDPPARVVLAWQTTAEWKFDPNFVTEVEVTFTAEGPRTTRVNLEHRNLDRFGKGMDDVRRAIDSPRGWTGILARYAEIAKLAGS